MSTREGYILLWSGSSYPNPLSRFAFLKTTPPGHTNPRPSLPAPLGPITPTLDLQPPKKRRVWPGNQGGSALCQHGTDFLHDLHTVQEDVRAVTTQDSQQQSLYQKWTDLCSTLLFNPALQDSFTPRIKLLQVYGHWIQHAQYSKCQVDRHGK